MDGARGNKWRWREVINVGGGVGREGEELMQREGGRCSEGATPTA